MFSLISRPLNERLARCEKALSLRFLFNLREARKLRREKLAEGCNQENRKCPSFHFPSDLVAKKEFVKQPGVVGKKKSVLLGDAEIPLPHPLNGAIGGKMESGLGERERERETPSPPHCVHIFFFDDARIFFTFPLFLGAHTVIKGTPPPSPEIAPRDMPTPQWKNIFFT